MTLPQLTTEIRDINLSFLTLAQAMIRSDKVRAAGKLGISRPVAELLAQVSAPQLQRLAARNVMLCTLRGGGEEMVFGLLADRHEPHGGQRAAPAGGPAVHPLVAALKQDLAQAEAA